MIRVIYARAFDKQYKKLPAPLRLKFKERRDIFLEDPLSPILNKHKLHGEYGGLFGINVTGDYRAVYRNIDEETIEFIAIGTHHQLYGS
ncbi:MAG: hypothetical protein COV10_04770 [Candidatus Vogelbacteria bacterium CG10_big_fil_rev_8_21_14_0_10_51_16]|uniref:Type II toxin-antitoxin system mRNA interferase toxin, RelE/StbE family n=1 Tax=Candidatus Vogelbacteria bacterium CG10_big_fil_rev_8_21_14_0_10_51_16 TaxID=1975045 RepID=A0A2H0RD74_9BACT|nr:MAG: hypothetical protein COV10_04770 [Candidatus Vogelbacteria bacterium CG10_big_fil_rev_8_21_14_0_10_51_16]